MSELPLITLLTVNAIPLLEVLISMDGQGKPKEIDPLVAGKFLELTKEDLDERMDPVVTYGFVNLYVTDIQDFLDE